MTPRDKSPSGALPYVVMFSFAVILVQALMFGYDEGGMKGVFIGSACAFLPLGFIVGLAWSPRTGLASVLAGIPAWLFLFALYKWSIWQALTGTTEHLPVVLEPISVSLFSWIGIRAGSRIAGLAGHRKRNQGAGQ